VEIMRSRGRKVKEERGIENEHYYCTTTTVLVGAVVDPSRLTNTMVRFLSEQQSTDSDCGGGN
jgi:hypothetical protein